MNKNLNCVVYTMIYTITHMKLKYNERLIILGKHTVVFHNNRRRTIKEKIMRVRNVIVFAADAAFKQTVINKFAHFLPLFYDKSLDVRLDRELVSEQNVNKIS